MRPLYDAIYPEADKRQQSETSPKCPKFGNDSVLIRPPDLTVDEKDTVWPGLHRFEEPVNGTTGYGVTWWDPRALTLGVPQSFGIRQEELLKESKDPEVLRKDLETHQNWRTRWDNVRQQASQASFKFRTARDQARTDLADLESEVQVIEIPPNGDRPAGMRFGALVHAAMAAVPLDANDIQVREITLLQARILGNDQLETVAAVTAVQSTLAHPFMTRAREAVLREQCRRETPVTLTLTDGTLIEGVLDLAFLENDGWIVVDFKTDRELEKELERYKRQVALYALSIKRATGQACAAVLMKI